MLLWRRLLAHLPRLYAPLCRGRARSATGRHGHATPKLMLLQQEEEQQAAASAGYLFYRKGRTWTDGTWP